MNIDGLVKFIPEFSQIFTQRYEILNYIHRAKKIGRRTLSIKLDISERIIRQETNHLGKSGYILIENSGMSITDLGTEILLEFKPIFKELNKFREKSYELSKVLNIKEVIVVKDDGNKELNSFTNLGYRAAEYLLDILSKGDYVGVTGGRTMHAVAQEMPEAKKSVDVTLIPARGGLGSSAEYQSNFIVADLAKKLKAKYHILTLPDVIGNEALSLLLENEDVKKAYGYLRDLNIIIFGIGRADTMSQIRGMSSKDRDVIITKGAVGEAFDHYFDSSGREIYRQDSIGITLEDFKTIPKIIGVAGGEDKSEAIRAISTLRKDMTLIIDESAADGIIRIINNGRLL